MSASFFPSFATKMVNGFIFRKVEKDSPELLSIRNVRYVAPVELITDMVENTLRDKLRIHQCGFVLTLFLSSLHKLSPVLFP